MGIRSLAAAVIAAAAICVGQANAAGIVEYGLEAPSPTLGRPIAYAVYKPFPAPPEGERWPVVYLLHGLGGADGDWFTWGNLGPILDQALADGRIPPMMVVAPDGADSWYVDSPDAGGQGLIDTAFATDLVAAIDARFPTASCREGRAIGGVSMGGVGALLQVINHPDTYVAAMGFSAALHRPMLANDPRSNWLPGLYGSVFGRPFDAARFNAANAFTLAASVRRMDEKPDFYLTIGDADFPDLIEANAAFHNLLVTTKADTSLRIGAGRHYWDSWQQAIIPALEWLAPRLDASCR